MRILKSNKDINKLLLIFFYSLIYAIGIQFFMQSANLLTTGMAGIGQILSDIVNVNYGIVYILINIPGIILGFKTLGKRFTFYSILNIFTVSIVTMYIPEVDFNLDPLVDAIFGGILMGFAIGKILKIGASSGGTDFYAMYLLKYRNKDFQKVNMSINMLVLISGILYFAIIFGFQKGVELGLYTIISLYIRNSVLDQTFTNTHTVTLFIVGTNVEEISQYVNSVLKRGTTIINNVEGGYTHNKMQMMMTTLNQYEYSLFIEKVDSFKTATFINIMDTKNVEGNYKKTKDKEV